MRQWTGAEWNSRTELTSPSTVSFSLPACSAMHVYEISSAVSSSVTDQ
jgi:hypothetical protein